MNSDRPFLTKLMGVDQISQLRPNFTISAKFHNPGILGIPGVRAVLLVQADRMRRTRSMIGNLTFKLLMQNSFQKYIYLTY